MAGDILVAKDFVQGDSFNIKVSHNPAIDITGAVFKFTLKVKEDSNTPSLEVEYTVPAGADATAGIAYVPIPTAKTAAVQAGTYFGSLTRTLGIDVITLVQSGINDARKVTVHKKL